MVLSRCGNHCCHVCWLQWHLLSGRLPRSFEWQYSGQGTDGRMYPWGNSSDPRNMPAVCRRRRGCGAEEVSAHPGGASPFGVEDLLGNVWQFTADEFVDDHTRRVVLRGGSNYEPAASSSWYYPQAKDLAHHNTLLLMDDSFDRAGTVGFRCVVDAAPTAAARSAAAASSRPKQGR